ncbi:hypothetical protein GSI_06614 [Ganoderma sinense ZZ0214-1]|uniref:Uncharacterized protein n=1 Tax=Ganoderma sinense ZZ0214-1 TaxID=1077348 RepID=A0A2G8SDR3_9APHY|nr:hypothetical protein GSI_06614 [Ganoderma sinense ZZ0214-1]
MYHTYGSHHIRLTNACAKLWNSLLSAQKKRAPQPASLRFLPELCLVDSHEKFGLVKMSMETATQYSLATIKQEPGDEAIDLSLPDLLDADHILREIGVDPSLLNAPVPTIEPSPGPPAAPASNVDIKGKGVKRVREEDDDVLEISPAEWPLQITTTSTGSGTSPSAIMIPAAPTAMPSSLSSSSSLATQPGPSVLLVPGTSEAGLSPSTIAISAPSTQTTAALTSLAITQPQDPAIAVATAPVIVTSSVATGTSHSPFTIPTLGAPATSTASGSTVAMAAPRPSSALDCPPPKKKAKKACLTVVGMPAPPKTRQSASQEPSSSSNILGQHSNLGMLDALFGRMSTAASMGSASAAFLNPTPTNEPCLPRAAIVGLTRSQRLFSVVTQVDPCALTFSKGGSSKEFFLFMELRATYKWATFQMSPFDWVCAASTYNTAIKKMNAEKGIALPLKTPRALLDKLMHSGKTQFWKHHCKAIYLGTKIQKMVDDQSYKVTDCTTPALPPPAYGQQSKNHVCSRCKCIMYLGGKNHKDNHSRNVCGDGVRQSPEKVHLVINGIARDFVEQPPPFPQPPDVFSDGNVFHPARFMQVVRTFYDRIVVNNKTVIVPGLDGRPSKVLFKLFHSFKLAPGEAPVLDDYEGEMCLRMDCLSEPPLEALQQDVVADEPGSSDATA